MKKKMDTMNFKNYLIPTSSLDTNATLEQILFTILGYRSNDKEVQMVVDKKVFAIFYLRYSCAKAARV